MSFRTRLTLFFVLIVIVPMVSVTFVVFRLIADNESGKADASVAQAQTFAVGLYRERANEARVPAREIAGDARLAAALRRGDDAAARERIAAVAPEGVVRTQIWRDGRAVADSGAQDAVAPFDVRVADTDGSELGVVRVATADAQQYSQQLARLASRVQDERDVEVVVREGSKRVGGTVQLGERALADRDRVTLHGRSFRVVTFPAQGFSDPPDSGRQSLQVVVLADTEAVTGEVRQSRLLAGVILAGFLILAFAFAVAVSRSLQAQIGRFLDAARRLGSGDFGAQIPIEGRDEFSALGGEFNKMSRQLEQRLRELDAERARLRQAMLRIGETFASNLDREGLLEIVVRTALEGLQADAARAKARDEGSELQERAAMGDPLGLEVLLAEAESGALESGAMQRVERDGAAALGAPLRAADGGSRVLGVLAVARTGAAFTEADAQLFGYLAGQAAVSIENVSLHEVVQRQAVTDELTGLFNHRRFQEVMDLEVERARRFDADLGLVLLDIDNFKSVNDNYGHQMGDRVLIEVAHMLRDEAREIDEPARYGGEELAVALPQTDLEGAEQMAERVRQRIEAAQIPLVDGEGTISVTASLGVAAAPACATEKEDLFAAADAALYRAKRSGKNMVVRAAVLDSLPDG